MPKVTGLGNLPPSQRWKAFFRNHAQSMLASDLFVAVAAYFMILHELVITVIETRMIVHFNIPDHTTAEKIAP
jgi:hypothetical protein